MASFNDTIADDRMIAPSAINWDEVKLPNDCEKCGSEYDCIDAAHESMCSVCQQFYDGSEYTNTATGFDSTNPSVASEEPPIKEGEIKCSICPRHFRPNANGNGVDCTWCCNRAARNGVDLFAKYGREMATMAKMKMEEYLEEQKNNAQAPQRSLPPSTTTTDAKVESTMQSLKWEPLATPQTSSRKHDLEDIKGDDESQIKEEHDTKRPKAEYDEDAK